MDDELRGFQFELNFNQYTHGRNRRN